MTFIYSSKDMTKVRIIQKLDDKVITLSQAVNALSCSERTIYRYLDKYRSKWPPWLLHGLKGKPSNHQSYHGKLDWLRELIGQKRFVWFGPTLLAEKLKEIYWFEFNRESLRQRMIQRWYWVPKQRKSVIKRIKRDRRASKWMLIQFDGSYHDWFENGGECCLLLAIDDATWQIIKMKFTEWESLEEVIQFWKEYMEEHGKPGAIYVDCHATYKVNHERDQFDHEMRTRFQVAMQQLWVEIIYSKCPQWKWRVERWFGTHQDRLVKEMRLVWIKDMMWGNKFIDEYYLPKHNRKFSQSAREKWDFHVPMTMKEREEYDWYFASIKERKIKHDGTISYNNVIYQIHKWQKLINQRKIIVKETICGDIKLFTWIYPLSFDLVRHK